MRKLLILSILIILNGCVINNTVRQKDLDTWVGIPIEALETHSFFVTVPLYKTKTESGIEIWNYANGDDVAKCFSHGNASGNYGYVSGTSFTTCSSGKVVCNNLFYIKDKHVLEYKPVGSCRTDETVQPESRYKNFLPSK